jgi:hypothetical protein
MSRPQPETSPSRIRSSRHRATRRGPSCFRRLRPRVVAHRNPALPRSGAGPHVPRHHAHTPGAGAPRIVRWSLGGLVRPAHPLAAGRADRHPGARPQASVPLHAGRTGLHLGIRGPVRRRDRHRSVVGPVPEPPSGASNAYLCRPAGSRERVDRYCVASPVASTRASGDGSSVWAPSPASHSSPRLPETVATSTALTVRLITFYIPPV